MGEKSQTLLVRKERCVENPYLWNNEEAMVSSRSQTPHELICAMVSRGSAGKHQKKSFFQAPSALRKEAERNRTHRSDFS